MITTNQFKNGMCIDLEGTLYIILEFQHVKPGKGAAFVRTKLKNLLNGTVLDRTFRAGEKVEMAHLDRRKMQFLYGDQSSYFFMDTNNYEQLSLEKEQIGDNSRYLKENNLVEILFYQEKPVLVEPSLFVELEVTKTDPGIKGDTATGGSKPATLETGLTIQVPLFVKVGDIVKVDTRTGEYVTRVS